MGESDFRLFQLNEGMLEVLGVWRFWTFKKKSHIVDYFHKSVTFWQLNSFSKRKPALRGLVRLESGN
jgi:hypothetical protein